MNTPSPNHEASDIDPSLGDAMKPVKQERTAAQDEADWVQLRDRPKGMQVNIRTGLKRYIPSEPLP